MASDCAMSSWERMNEPNLSRSARSFRSYGTARGTLVATSLFTSSRKTKSASRTRSVRSRWGVGGASSESPRLAMPTVDAERFNAAPSASSRSRSSVASKTTLELLFVSPSESASRSKALRLSRLRSPVALRNCSSRSAAGRSCNSHGKRLHGSVRGKSALSMACLLQSFSSSSSWFFSVSARVIFVR